MAGGVTKSACPYKCISDKYRMPNCYTPLEDLFYTFGGPWPFAVLLAVILVILAFLLSALRVKLLGFDSCRDSGSVEQRSHSHYPYLLSLSEVPDYMSMFHYRRNLCYLSQFSMFLDNVTNIGAGIQGGRITKSCSQNVLHGPKYIWGAMASSLHSSRRDY